MNTKRLHKWLKSHAENCAHWESLLHKDILPLYRELSASRPDADVTFTEFLSVYLWSNQQQPPLQPFASLKLMSFIRTEPPSAVLNAPSRSSNCRCPLVPSSVPPLDDAPALHFGRCRCFLPSPLPLPLPSPPSSPPCFFSHPLLIVSYPRSGNTLLRTMLEGTTRSLTGSDTSPHRLLGLALANEHSLAGEGVLDGRVSSVKTHYPERSGVSRLEGDRVVLLVRNVWDAVDSYFNMCLTNTHDRSVKQEVYDRHKDKFDGLFESDVAIWAKFNAWWICKCKEVGVPILVLRFEDLVRHPEESLRRVVGFMIKSPVIEKEDKLPEFWEERVKLVTAAATPVSAMGSYKPRTGGSDTIGKSLLKGRYSLQQQRDALSSAAGPSLRSFGYDCLEQGFPTSVEERGLPLRKNCVQNWPGTAGATITVNQGVELRGKGNAYGRAMTDWRRSHTKNDTQPFETVQR